MEPQPQQQYQQQNSHLHYFKKQGFIHHHNTSPTNLVYHGGGCGHEGGLTGLGTSNGGGTTTCQYCGNQARSAVHTYIWGCLWLVRLRLWKARPEDLP